MSRKDCHYRAAGAEEIRFASNVDPSKLITTVDEGWLAFAAAFFDRAAQDLFDGYMTGLLCPDTEEQIRPIDREMVDSNLFPSFRDAAFLSARDFLRSPHARILADLISACSPVQIHPDHYRRHARQQFRCHRQEAS